MKTLFFNAIEHAEGTTLMVGTRPGARTRPIPLGTFNSMEQVHGACQKFQLILKLIDQRRPGELKFTSQDVDWDHLLVANAVRYDLRGPYKIYRIAEEGLVLMGQFETEEDALAAMAA